MQVNYQTTQEERTIWTKIVCADIAQCCSSMHQHAFAPTKKMTKALEKSTGEGEALCIAIWRCDIVLVRSLMRDGVSIWGTATFFGSTPDFITAKASANFISDIFVEAGPTTDGRKRGGHKRNINSRITSAAVRGDESTCTQLLKWYDHNTNITPSSASVEWVRLAITGGLTEFLMKLLPLENSSLVRKAYLEHVL
jgi:hypothetical protein